MIIDVAAEVLAEAKIGVPGSSLFVYHAPENVKKCVLVTNLLNGTERDENLPGYKKTQFEVIVRHTEYQSALSIAKKVVAALDFHRKTVNGIYVQRMRPTHDPIPYPIADSDVLEVAVNLWAVYVEPQA